MRLRHKKNAVPTLEKNPLIYFYASENRGHRQEIFGNDNPIELEIGAGKGDFITKLALENPATNYIALESNTDAFVVAGRKFEENKLTNVRGIVANAREIDSFFEGGDISKIYLNFSTPRPKRKHHKRRLTYKDFLEIYKSVVKDGADLELKTDDRGFFEDSIKYMEAEGLDILEIDYSLAEEKSIVTEYEKKRRDRGLPIYYLRAKFRL